MSGQRPDSSVRDVVRAALLSVILAASGGATQAQGVPPPPAPRLPPVPSLPVFVAPPAYAPPQSGRCGREDWSCRLDRLERRVAELEEQLDRAGDRGGGRRGRSVDMTVEQDCIFDSCSAIATRLCTDGGFARGVPIEMRQNGSWQRLVRATCLD
ncbi:MAG: hypothetical protein ACT6RD_08015 [Brevundimonas sp.]|uniref:hypothetical protein n=1 Tax=Brevundimonas sp. TaxID=1871086 RepID=UPI004033E22B